MLYPANHGLLSRMAASRSCILSFLLPSNRRDDIKSRFPTNFFVYLLNFIEYKLIQNIYTIYLNMQLKKCTVLKWTRLKQDTIYL